MSWILWSIFAAAAVVVAFKWLTLGQPWMKWVYWGAVLLPAAGIALTSLFRRISVRYRLTTHRLFKEVGIISRRISEIELLRVDDLSVSQNIVQRIFDVGVVTLVTSDASDPTLTIAGIRNPIQVKEHIRTQVQKRRARTINLETL
ncbi:MAG TPA: PH domain-containing protein [Planctomycetota bacterium]|nr:PH domain-containing protein [Planctomycetota bacterium]